MEGDVFAEMVVSREDDVTAVEEAREVTDFHFSAEVCDNHVRVSARVQTLQHDHGLVHVSASNVSRIIQ